MPYTRVYPGTDGKTITLTPGQSQYGKGPDGVWVIMHPTLGIYRLESYHVRENSDGTIDVIGQINHGAKKAGYFKAVDWRDAP